MKDKLHTLKLKVEELYSNNNKVTLAVLRVLFALIVFFYINTSLGAYKLFANPIVTLALSGVSAVLPVPIIMVIGFILIALHLYKISIIMLGGFLVLLATMYLLVFRLCGDKWIIVFLSLILFWIKLPYLIPIMLGIIFSSSIVIPGTLAIMLALFLDIAKSYKIDEATTTISNISSTFTSIAKDGYIIMWLVVVAITILVVSIVKTFSIKNNKEIAIISGGITEIVGFLAMSFALKVQINIFVMIILTIVSVLIAIILLWAFFPFNYEQTEYVEFFDDEYYYYVRAVPLGSKKKEEIKREKSLKNRVEREDIVKK